MDANKSRPGKNVANQLGGNVRTTQRGRRAFQSWYTIKCGKYKNESGVKVS